MRKFLQRLMMLFSVVLLGAGITACTDTPEEGEQGEPATLTAEVTNSVANAVDVTVNSTGISEFAYMLQLSTESEPLAVIVFKDGTTVKATSDITTIKLDNLEYQTDYTLYIAGKLASKNGGFYNEVVSVDFSTANYTDEVTMIRINYDGADIHVDVPEDVKARGNKLKWFVSSAPDNKKWKPSATGYFTDAELVQQNDNNYPAFLIHRDTTLRIREENRIFTSPYDGELSEYYPRIAPGEPLVVSIQEVTYVSDDSNSGWGAGWYGTPFLWEQFMNDYFAAAGGGGLMPWNVNNYVEAPTRAMLPSEEDYWPENSWHKTLHFTTKRPEALNGAVEIGTQGYDSRELSPKGGKVMFTPTGDTYCYCVSILDHALYQSILLNWLDGSRDQLQWFITSNFAAYEGLASTLYANSGPTSIDIAEWFGGNVLPGGTYHVLVTAMGGKEGAEGMEADATRQSFSQLTFELPNYSLPAPEIKVTGLEPTGPYGVRFNIKCTNADVAPVEKASFACDYVRSFKLYIDSYEYTYSQLVEMNTLQGVYFNDAVVKGMNSPAGFDIEFESREDAASGLVVMGWNYEGRPSNPDAEGSEAYAEARSAVLPDAEKVESSLFEELKGEWTATATLEYLNKNYYPVDENGENLKDEQGNIISEEKLFTYEVKTKVTIGDITHPATLPESVYDLYGSSTPKATVDALFEEFKELTAHNNRKTRGQNRLLCQGLDFDVAEVAYANILNHQSAWDLFVSPTYSSASTEDIFYDFGPKWYLQIDKQGNIFVPVNINSMLPTTNWQDAKVHLVGYAPDTNQALIAPADGSNDVTTWPNLPVELSADKNTMTIKPFVYTSDEGSVAYYPNFIIDTETEIYGMIPMNGKNKGNIVLTRGWSDMITVTAKIDDQMTRSGVAQRNVAPIKSANGAEVERKVRHNRTNLNAIIGNKPAVTYTEVDVKPINREKFIK